MSVFRPSLNEHGLTEQQWRIIRILERYGELEIYQLAELACILKPSMTGVLVRMEAAGMVRRLAGLGGAFYHRHQQRLGTDIQQLLDQRRVADHRSNLRLAGVGCHDLQLREHALQVIGRVFAAALDSLTRLIMIRLLRLCAHSLPARPMRHEDLRIFHRFNELIEAHYLEHWPLARYAEGIGVTEAQLNEVCRRIADLPSKRLILERVMQQAKRLLLFTGNSANEICYRLGFKDPAYFSRFFLRYAQVTPGEYRLLQAGSRL